MAREPNTNYHVQLLHFQQRDKECKDKLEKAALKATAREMLNQKFMIHCDKKSFRNEIEARVHTRLRDYENSIEERRVRLVKLRKFRPFTFL